MGEYWDANATSVLTSRVLCTTTTVTVHVRCLYSMLMSNGTTEAGPIVTGDCFYVYRILIEQAIYSTCYAGPPTQLRGEQKRTGD